MARFSVALAVLGVVGVGSFVNGATSAPDDTTLHQLQPTPDERTERTPEGTRSAVLPAQSTLLTHASCRRCRYRFDVIEAKVAHRPIGEVDVIAEELIPEEEDSGILKVDVTHHIIVAAALPA